MASYAPPICRGRNGQPGCGEEIRWVKNAKTLRMEPVDAEPASAGNIVIEGGLAVHLSAERAKAYEGEKYISHFATCANAEAFRTHKPNRATARPADIPMGTFDSPAAAAIGRIEADALDLTVERLVGEFCDHVRDSLGDHPDQDALQHAWRDWQRAKRNLGVDPDTLLVVAKRAKAQLRTAEVTAA